MAKLDPRILRELKRSVMRDIRTPPSPMQVLRAIAHIEVLEGSLLKYGCHTVDCKLQTVWDGDARHEASYRLSKLTGLKCTCGLHAILGIEPAP